MGEIEEGARVGALEGLVGDFVVANGERVEGETVAS